MLRTLAVSSLIVWASATAPALAQQPAAPSVAPAVETCLRANAERVSAQAASLTDAVDFLLDNVCAVELTAEAQRAQRLRFEAMRARMCENGQPTAAALQSDPEDEDGAAAFAAYCANDQLWANISSDDYVIAFQVSAADRALAAQLILAARSSRQ